MSLEGSLILCLDRDHVFFTCSSSLGPAVKWDYALSLVNGSLQQGSSLVTNLDDLEHFGDTHVPPEALLENHKIATGEEKQVKMLPGPRLV